MYFVSRSSPTFFKIDRWSSPHMKDNRLACCTSHIKTSNDDVIITLWRHQVGHFWDFYVFLRIFHFYVSVTSTFFEIINKQSSICDWAVPHSVWKNKDKRSHSGKIENVMNCLWLLNGFFWSKGNLLLRQIGCCNK